MTKRAIKTCTEWFKEEKSDFSKATGKNLKLKVAKPKMLGRNLKVGIEDQISLSNSFVVSSLLLEMPVWNGMCE